MNIVVPWNCDPQLPFTMAPWRHYTTFCNRVSTVLYTTWLWQKQQQKVFTSSKQLKIAVCIYIFIYTYIYILFFFFLLSLLFPFQTVVWYVAKDISIKHVFPGNVGVLFVLYWDVVVCSWIFFVNGYLTEALFCTYLMLNILKVALYSFV